MGPRSTKCFDSFANGSQQRFADPWWRKYDTPTDGFIDSSGKVNRLPLRLESTEVIVYGFADAKKMWAEFEALGEPFVPVLVGGKAVVTVWFNNFTDTDCGGAYLETWYNTFVTPKGEPQLELPCETPFSAIIQDARSLSYLQRVCCSESPKSTGAGAVAVEGGRSIWGFPKHPELAKITFDYVDDSKKVDFLAEHSGKKAVSLHVDIPIEGAEGTVTIPLEIETAPDALISGPRLGGTHKGHNGSLQTRYGVAFKCTQHVKLWDPATDSLEFGDDLHYATPIKGWNFEPALKVHSPDFKILAHKPSNWLTGTEAANKITPSTQDKPRFCDEWWRKYDTPTDGFIDSRGMLNRLPLRLESTEVIVYGLVDAEKMWAEFEALNEPFVPVLVGGKAVVTVWFNNFTDTDCGGAYLETWYNTFVTPKGEPQLELPYEAPFSAIIQDPRSLSYLQRVCCSESPKSTGAGAVAIEGGRSIWGFPKHPELGEITFEYTDDSTKVAVDATHSGKKAVSLRVDIPQEGAEGTVTIPLEIETAPNSLIGGPRLGGTHLGHNGAQQTRYGVAFKCTQHVRPWDAATDSLDFGDDLHYATPIKRWGFEPVLKVHSPDFKILAHKPCNWISGNDVAAAMLART
jgi:hypothetical protein